MCSARVFATMNCDSSDSPLVACDSSDVTQAKDDLSQTCLDKTNGSPTNLSDEMLPRRRVGRPKGRRTSLIHTSARRRWLQDGVEHLVYFRTLTKEQLLQKAQSLPPDMDLYDICRRPRTLDNDSLDETLCRVVRLSDTGLTEDLSCPICMGTYQSVAVVKDCLHRFCEECIERWLRTGHQDCPKCRNRIPSRRSLRADPIFQRIVQRMFPDVQDFERMNDQAIATVNRRRTGLSVVVSEEGGSSIRPRRGRGGGFTCKVQREMRRSISETNDDQTRKSEGCTVVQQQDNGTNSNINVIELKLIPDSVEMSELSALKLKPLKVLSISHIIRMIKSASSSAVASMDLHLSIDSKGNPLDPSLRLSNLLATLQSCAQTTEFNEDKNKSVLTLHIWSKTITSGSIIDSHHEENRKSREPILPGNDETNSILSIPHKRNKNNNQHGRPILAERNRTASSSSNKSSSSSSPPPKKHRRLKSCSDEETQDGNCLSELLQ